MVNLESEVDSLYTLTEAEKSAVAEGMKDVSEGRLYSSEAADSTIKGWLKGK
jgi:predicted transcriptional regulator